MAIDLTHTEMELALRRGGAGLLKGVYWLTARAYNTILVDMLGYRAPELAADAFAARWRGGDGPVLDLGCGTGLTAAALSKRVSVVVDGLDYSSSMLDQARRKGLYRHLVEADATKTLPLEPESYAGAISSGLFTHGHVGPEALEPLLAALAPGALFAFTVYSVIWRRSGFGEALDRLAGEGRIAVLSHEEVGHFTRLRGQKVHVIAVRAR